MTRKINIKESEYKRAKKAIESLKSVKGNMKEIQKTVWKVQNKLKQR